jgi:hypothetical protein
MNHIPKKVKTKRPLINDNFDWEVVLNDGWQLAINILSARV